MTQLQNILQILALMSLLENTMNLFTSKSTRDNMRQLLLAYGKAIIEVIKERQSEINYSSSGADYETRKKNKSCFLFRSMKCMYRKIVVQLFIFLML